MKVQISIDETLLKKIDEYAKRNFMSRSGFISMSCTSQLSTFETINLIKQMNELLQKIAANGSIDEETKQKLLQFEMISKALTRQ